MNIRKRNLLLIFVYQPSRYKFLRNKKRVCQNPLFNKITPATDTCDRGDFSVLGVLTHPLLLVIKNRLVHILIDPSSEIFQNLLYQLLSDREYPD